MDNSQNYDLMKIKDEELKALLKDNLELEEINNNGTIIKRYSLKNEEIIRPLLDQKFKFKILNNLKYLEWLPFVSKEVLAEVSNSFLKGVKIDNFITVVPFLDKESLRLLGLKLSEVDPYNGLRFIQIVPFLTSKFIFKKKFT